MRSGSRVLEKCCKPRNVLAQSTWDLKLEPCDLSLCFCLSLCAWLDSFYLFSLGLNAPGHSSGNVFACFLEKLLPNK